MNLRVIPLRYYSNSSRPWKQRLHAYGQTNSCTSLEKLSELLLSNVLFNEDGLVVINKPYGVGLENPHTSGKSSLPDHDVNIISGGYNTLYLNEVLPRISKALGYPQLSVVKAAERYASGITILSADEKISSKVHKCVMKSRGQQHLFNSYLAVVIGCPNPSTSSEKVGLKLEIDPSDGGRKVPVIVNKWSRNAVERREVIPIKVELTTLQTSQLASLIEVKPSKTKWHFLRVYMAHLLSPILGDHLYGSRVQKVLGVPLNVSPFSDVAKQSQKLSREMLAALDLRPGEEVIIPTHVHLHQVTLLDYRGHGKHVAVQAPLPENFIWTCKQLNLQ